MKNLRRKFELYCYKNRNKGIPNLMLYIVLGTAVVYVMSRMYGNAFLYYLLCFDRGAILQGQVWRLITYPLTYSAGQSAADRRVSVLLLLPGASHGEHLGHSPV